MKLKFYRRIEKDFRFFENIFLTKAGTDVRVVTI